MTQNNKFKNLTNAITFINLLKKNSNYLSLYDIEDEETGNKSIFYDDFKDDRDLKDAIDYIGDILNGIILNFLYQLPDVKDIRKILEEKDKKKVRAITKINPRFFDWNERDNLDDNV